MTREVYGNAFCLVGERKAQKIPRLACQSPAVQEHQRFAAALPMQHAQPPAICSGELLAHRQKTKPKRDTASLGELFEERPLGKVSHKYASPELGPRAKSSVIGIA